MLRVRNTILPSYSLVNKANQKPENNFLRNKIAQANKLHKQTKKISIMTGSIAPPVAKLVDHVVTFGKVEGEDRGPNPMDPPRTRNDPLFWMRDDERKNPEVLSYIAEETAYFQDQTSDIAELSDTIYREHVAHIEETDMTAPFRRGRFVYYVRNVKGQSYKIHCRVPVGETAGDPKVEQVILDENRLAAGKSHCDVRHVAPSPTEDIIAFSVDFQGDEVYDICFVTSSFVASSGGADLPPLTFEKQVGGTNGSVLWGSNDEAFFYTTKDAAKRDDKVWLHKVGNKGGEDLLVHHEPDTVYYANAGKSLDNSTLVVGSGSSETSEFRIFDLGKVQQCTTVEEIAQLGHLVRPRVKGVRYSIEIHKGEELLILTNADGCVNNKIVLTTRSDLANWDNVIVPHDKDVFLEDLAVFENFAVVSGRYGGLARIWTISGGTTFAGQSLREMKFDEPVFTAEPVHAHNKLYSATSFRIVYSSMTTPSTWFDVCPFSHNKTSVKVRFVGGGFDSNNYICERRFATAPDGTQIPMSVVYRKDLDRTKPQPCMLYGYGSYGICLDPEFSISYLPFVDRGMVYCLAHIRGGGEMGRAWYEVGAKYLTKRNTFQDFISCGEALIESKVTTASQLACEGRSAGGLLIGAVLNMRPDLFACAIAGVPFVDVLTTMCDPSIPLTTGEWEEWGNPNEYKYFDYMKSYSPVDNVTNQAYPPLFIQAGLHDPRVAYWEPLKWAATLRRLKTDANPVLVKMEMEHGHFSASDRYKYWRELAQQQAFVVKHCVRKLL